MISVSIFSTQADRLFVPCELMEAEALFFAGVQWAVFPASHAWSCTSNNPGSRQVKSSRVGIDLPHQTHHHWHCSSANTCLFVLRPFLPSYIPFVTPYILIVDRTPPSPNPVQHTTPGICHLITYPSSSTLYLGNTWLDTSQILNYVCSSKLWAS